jgi:hypothetical protein
MTLFCRRSRLTAGSGAAHPNPQHVAAASHDNPRLHLAVNLIHLIATMGAVIETARELGDWLHLF